MKGWEEIELGAIITTLKGAAFKSSLYQNEGVPVVRVSDFTDDSISDSELVFYPNDEVGKYKKYLLNKWDVLIQTVGSWQHNPASIVGKVVKVPEKLEGALLNQNIVKIIANCIADNKFIYYRLKDNSFKYYNLNCAQGAANQASITLSSIRKFRFLLPPLPTQHRIASILSAYDDLIENNLRRIKLLEELAQRTYEEWFVKFTINGEKLPLNEERGLPEGWERKKLIDVANLTMGQSPKSEYYNFGGMGLPFHQGVKDYGVRFPENSTWSKSGNRFAFEDDILFSVRAPVGRLNIAIEKFILGRGLAAINHKKGYTSFLFYQLQTIFYKDDMMGGGAIFNSVTKSDVQRIAIIEPENKVLGNFNGFANNIDSQIKKLTLQNRLLKESRDILLPRLMGGVIDLVNNN